MRSPILICCLIVSINLFAQLPDEHPLYPQGIQDNPVVHPQKEMFVDSLVHPKSLTGLNRVYSYVSEPTYMIFPANPDKNKNLGLIIYPGGGLKNIWLDKEGTDIALWLSEQGITCMVVKYRTNRKDEKGNWEIDYGTYKGAVYKDGRTSMMIMKGLADSLSFDRNRVGMMGFSAGGWLAERMVHKYYNGDYEWSPAYAALIYYGNNIKRIKKIKDRENLPPFFMALSENDEKLPLKKVMPYLEMVNAEVDHSELHVYKDGRHGFGLAYDENQDVYEWKMAFVNWLDKLYK